MTLTIIAGTHTFVDLTGRFRKAWMRAQQRQLIYEIDGVRFKKRRFERVEITTEGKVIPYPSRIFPLDRYGYAWSVAQPTGSGKTILAVYHLKRTYLKGGNIDANFSYQFFEHNIGKPPEEWRPSILTMEDLQKAHHTHLTIDDVKGTIESWQAKEADVITLVANAGRKESIDLDFTTQRVINYMPPNIRAVATGYEIPYITIRDMRKPSPDNKGFPFEMEIFSLLPADNGDVFVGFGCLNKDVPDGKLIRPTIELLNSYRTMELARGLKVEGSNEDGARFNQPGYQTEREAYEFLLVNTPEIKWQHLNGKHEFDIISDLWAIDVCGQGQDEDGKLRTEFKNFTKHIKVAKRKGQKPYLMFKYAGSWGFIPITYHLNDACSGQRVDIAHHPVKTYQNCFQKNKNDVNQKPQA